MLYSSSFFSEPMAVEDQDYRSFKYSTDIFDSSQQSTQQAEEQTENQNSKTSNICVTTSSQTAGVIAKSNKQRLIVGFDRFSYHQNNSLNIKHELIITAEGALRYFPAQNWISFGFQQQSAVAVEEKKNLGVVSIQFEKLKNQNTHGYNSAYEYLQKIPGVQTEVALPILETFQNLYLMLNAILLQVNEEIQMSKDYELGIFTQFCQNYIQNYTLQNPHKMFSYSIGRLNLAMKDFQTTSVGYSNEYLSLLGLDRETLSQIAMRKQKVDLQQNMFDITYHSLRALQYMDCKNNDFGDERYETQIVTFDGFPLKLYSLKKIFCDIFIPQKQYGSEFEYLLTITEMDVDLKDLENLIQYRQRISEKDEKLSLDDFLKKELSYQFEDVEYSVHSQEFVDKFYNQNLISLKKQQKLKKDEKNTCKFKYITSHQ